MDVVVVGIIGPKIQFKFQKYISKYKIHNEIHCTM